MRQLEHSLDAFRDRGVEVITVSNDGRDRARKAKEAWKLEQLTVGYDFSLDDARRWGLYISEGIGTTSSGIEEPPLFSEPAVYLVRPDSTLYFGHVQTMPFARPDFEQLLKAVDYALDKNYPARGEVLDHHRAATHAD